MAIKFSGFPAQGSSGYRKPDRSQYGIGLLLRSDIIHCHDYGTFWSWYLPFRFILFWKPVFITFHGYEGFPLKREAIRVRRWVEGLTWGNICAGDFIRKWYGTRTDYVTYGGVRPPESEPEQVEAKRAVFLGRLSEDSGIRLYITSLQILKDRYSLNLELDVLGGGTLLEEIKGTVAERGLKINLYGFVENTQDYLNQARFAFVSGYLGMLEAMVHKRLVFSVYDNPLKRDYLEMFPHSDEMIVTAGSPEQLAERIAYYLPNPDQERERVNKAYLWAREQGWEKVAELYRKLWGET
jgi:glycosyltransferase involved in cell wall biosynthesis